MITEIQNLENAARIATADALLSDFEDGRGTPVLVRWYAAVCVVFETMWRGFGPLRVG